MNVDKMVLPYPVLGIRDDIMPLPEIDVKPVRDNGSEYIFDIELNVNNEDIEELIRRGDAEYVCEIECPRTFLRMCVRNEQPFFRIKIDKQNVAKVISFQVTVTVKKAISDYINKNFHEDYSGYRFNLEPGDLLAVFSTFQYDAEIEYSRLRAVGAFMEIVLNDRDEETRVEIKHDKIQIYLPQSMYDDYLNRLVYDMRLSSIIHASLVFNALLEALYNFKKSLEEGWLWARTLAYRFKTEENLKRFYDMENDELCDNGNIFEVAQTLLGKPYQRMFNCLIRITENDSLIDNEE